MKKSILLGLFTIMLFHYSLTADPGNRLLKSQTVYVPAYSHIYSGETERPFLLTVTLSIRNIDPSHPIEITKADYFETQGALLKSYISVPEALNPLGAIRYVVTGSKLKGGSGANFLVHWRSKEPVNPPIIESIMIGTQNQQGVSFTSRGKAIYSTN